MCRRGDHSIYAEKLVFDQLGSTVRTIRQVKKYYNASLELTGIMPVAIDLGLKGDREYAEAMKQLATTEQLHVLPLYDVLLLLKRQR